MSLVINVDSYVSVSEADTYFSNRPFNTAWVANDDRKEASLRMAARHLDLMYQWLGSPALSTQTMSWPRIDLVTRNGALMTSTEVPQDIKDAQCELAYQWHQSDQLTPAGSSFTADDSTIINGGVQREKLGPLEREYNSTNQLGFLFGVGDRARLKKVYPLVDMLVKPYVSSTSSGIFREIRM